MIKTTTRSGFTLVELSIVLVIIGLLVGGVLTGQSLIRAAEMRSVTTQYQRYITATMTFRDKYMAIPGDMTNATAYWGTQAAGTACVTSASTTAATCNGDGDGNITVSTNANELYRFWQHLANAGLIEGNYDGITHGSTTNSTTTANAPSGRISGSLWHAEYKGTLTSFTTSFDGIYNNSLIVGAYYANGVPGNPIFKPEEAYNIDTKVDDGKPATGKVVMVSAGGFNTCTDASASSTLTANYNLSYSVLACGLIFRQQF